MKLPNFFILGAPKCGTTALAQWLREHPNIYMPPVKEPHFYSTDFNNRQARTRSEYNRLFKHAHDAHIAVGEASAWYLYSAQAVPNILNEIPDARFIVCLRNPVEMAYSLHNHNITANNENIQDFDEAWAAQSLRKEGREVPVLCVDPEKLLYARACALGSQLERLYQWCQPNHIHLVFLDDLKEDARTTYRNVLEFLSVPDDGRQHFAAVNSASERRFQVLAKAIKALSITLRKVGIPPLGTGITLTLNRLNRRKSSRSGLSSSTRKRLYKCYEQDIQKIETLADKTLTHWKYY